MALWEQSISGLEPASLFIWTTTSLIAFTVGWAIYNIYLHPLSKFPGPKLAAISELYYVYWTNSGRLYIKLKQLHDQYGDVVRIAPSSLTYKTAQAWKDIYGHWKHGQSSFAKDDRFYVSDTPGSNIQEAFDDVDHARQRRLLSSAFSERALRDQEPIIQSYVDLLVERLHTEATSYRGTVDMTPWYDYTTFDILGDLSFRESFGCLRDRRYHPTIQTSFRNNEEFQLLRSMFAYPLLASMVRYVIPTIILPSFGDYFQLSKEKINRRLETKTNRPDFTSYILRYNDERGMTHDEIEANAALLIIAGSETTSTLLSGCAFFLLTHPHVYQKLVDEIRGSFRSPEDITSLSTAKLPYLHAVLEESLRLYPPVPAITPRLVPKRGAVVDGQFVPEGVSVSVAYYSTFRASSNFADPDSFIPDRWLANKDPKFALDKKDAFQVFSYGPRNCIGQNLAYTEMRLIMAKLLWNFDMKLKDDSSNRTGQRAYALWEKQPLMITLSRRFSDEHRHDYNGDS